MSEEREPTTIFPVVMDFNEGPYFDFRPVIVPADTPDEVAEEEVPDPKDDSAREPVGSSESPQVTGQTPTSSPVLPPAAVVTSPPKVPSPGSSAS